MQISQNNEHGAIHLNANGKADIYIPTGKETEDNYPYKDTETGIMSPNGHIIMAPGIEVKGPITSKDISVTGDITATKTITGTVDVIGGGKSLATHTHSFSTAVSVNAPNIATVTQYGEKGIKVSLSNQSVDYTKYTGLNVVIVYDGDTIVSDLDMTNVGPNNRLGYKTFTETINGKNLIVTTVAIGEPDSLSVQYTNTDFTTDSNSGKELKVSGTSGPPN